MDMTEVYEHIYRLVLDYDNKYLIKRLKNGIYRYKVSLDKDYYIDVDKPFNDGWVHLKGCTPKQFMNIKLNDRINRSFLKRLALAMNVKLEHNQMGLFTSSEHS